MPWPFGVSAPQKTSLDEHEFPKPWEIAGNTRRFGVGYQPKQEEELIEQIEALDVNAGIEKQPDLIEDQMKQGSEEWIYFWIRRNVQIVVHRLLNFCLYKYNNYNNLRNVRPFPVYI